MLLSLPPEREREPLRWVVLRWCKFGIPSGPNNESLDQFQHPTTPNLKEARDGDS